MVLGGGTFSREGEQRVFAYAVLASIVLHAVLLFAGFQLRDPVRKSPPIPGPIIARLMESRPAAAPAPAAPAAKPLAARPAPPPPRVAAPQPVPVPLAKAAPTAPLIAATPLPAGEAPPPAADSPASAAPAAPSSSPGPIARSEAQPAPVPAEAADAGTLDQYRIAIYSAAKRYKKYPRAATDNGWEGRVVIRLVIGANTMINSMSIKTSSGHEILDQAALDTIRKAKPLVPIPAALRGREFSLDINFIFNLKDENA